MQTVRFYFDFSSPNVYLAHKLVPHVEARTGAKFQYVPMLLGGVFKLTNNKAPLVAFAEIKNKIAYERREFERFVAKHKLSKFRMSPFFPIGPVQMMRGALAAEKLGVYEAYNEAVFAGAWERELKMDDAAILQDVLTEAGLPTTELLSLAQTEEIKQKLASNTQEAVDKGVFGAPSFFVGNELYFGKDRLRDVEEALTAGV